VTALSDNLADLAGLAHMEGCAVLDGVDDFLARFIAYPNEHARRAHTLWLAHAWRIPACQGELSPLVHSKSA
jgi:hypothetical protein